MRQVFALIGLGFLIIAIGGYIAFSKAQKSPVESNGIIETQ